VHPTCIGQRTEEINRLQKRHCSVATEEDSTTDGTENTDKDRFNAVYGHGFRRVLRG